MPTRSETAVSSAEHALLIHRLRSMAETHEHLAQTDSYADTADTLSEAMARNRILCSELLREAVSVLGAS